MRTLLPLCLLAVGCGSGYNLVKAPEGSLASYGAWQVLVPVLPADVGKQSVYGNEQWNGMVEAEMKALREATISNLMNVRTAGKAMKVRLNVEQLMATGEYVVRAAFLDAESGAEMAACQASASAAKGSFGFSNSPSASELGKRFAAFVADFSK